MKNKLKARTIPYSEVKKELLKDPEFKKEYEKLQPRLKVVNNLIRARYQLNLTQAQLAKKIGTSQSLISRIEAGNTSPSLDFLTKLAEALNSNLEIKFKPRQ